MLQAWKITWTLYTLFLVSIGSNSGNIMKLFQSYTYIGIAQLCGSNQINGTRNYKLQTITASVGKNDKQCRKYTTYLQNTTGTSTTQDVNSFKTWQFDTVAFSGCYQGILRRILIPNSIHYSNEYKFTNCIMRNWLLNYLQSENNQRADYQTTVIRHKLSYILGKDKLYLFSSSLYN